MNGKKIMIIGMCFLIITTSFNMIIGKADDTGNGTLVTSGTTSSADIWYPTIGRFNYYNGNAIGSFVNFKIDENTGIISDYTVKLTFYPSIWDSSMSSVKPYPEKEIFSDNITYLNKKIFNSIQINDFKPIAVPNTFADYLIFQGENNLMKFIDSEGGSINYASSDKNTKIIFEVPDGFIISQLYDNTYNILPVTDEDTGENSNIEKPDQLVEIIGEWELLSYGDVNNKTFAIKDVKTFIQFDMSSKFTGNVGCNSFSGIYNINDYNISFDSISSTEMYCEETWNQEKGVLYLFSQPNLTIQSNNENLTITNGIYVLNLKKIGTEIIYPDSDIITSPWQNIWIKSDNTTSSINIYNGTFTINKQTIEVDLNAYGYLDIYTWIEYPVPTVVNNFWYEDLNITRDEILIEDAKSNGIISAEGWVTDDPVSTPTIEEQSSEWEQIKIANTASNNYYTYDDPTFEMTFNNINKNGVDVIINSQISSGRIVIINVDREVVQTKSIEDLIVSIDNSEIKKVNALEDLMLKVENKDTNGAYFALSGEQLTTIFVFVPHFSTHTISIKTLAAGIASVSNILLPIILSVIFICLLVVGIVIKNRKKQDDF